MAKKQIAIACQGGGSHTAFTAGVLKKLLEQNVHQEYEITGISGTSGGAICATLAWYGILKEKQGDSQKSYERLIAFWQDNTAVWPWEILLNTWAVSTIRLEETGVIPTYNVSPYDPRSSAMTLQLETVFPRKEFVDFELLLNKYIAFAELPELKKLATDMRLYLGAVDVLSGRFRVFDSRKNEITVDAVRASAAIPTLFQAVEMEEHSKKAAYWDGLFSENPPISPFYREVAHGIKPDEIWVIQINPVERKDVPRSLADIGDRRNQLAGNLSLYQEISFLWMLDDWIKDGSLTEQHKSKYGLKPIKVRGIHMSDALCERLDHVSKLDRSEYLMSTLIENGEHQAAAFLAHPDKHILRPKRLWDHDGE